MKLLKLLANLGYGSRKEIARLFADGRVSDRSGRVLEDGDVVAPDDILIDGEPLDPPPGILLMLHKPCGYTCSTEDPGSTIYELLPPRFRHRSPVIASAGRLDRDTSGLLVMTDDGQLLHRITSPRSKLAKVYVAQLARDLDGTEGEHFASGRLMLKGETNPLAAATLEPLGARTARVIVTEGRYHQVRRMFAALGNHVVALHREKIGGLDLGGLPSGTWRLLAEADRVQLFGAKEPGRDGTRPGA